MQAFPSFGGDDKRALSWWRDKDIAFWNSPPFSRNSGRRKKSERREEHETCDSVSRSSLHMQEQKLTGTLQSESRTDPSQQASS